ncbi:MerR family transcriptional regulator [candidate division GN15 bacterium]|jgi:DNA-binding transcriptional MerR regulator|nr:MerR family transcriptional regulator [candidate division GN15 bacterium]
MSSKATEDKRYYSISEVSRMTGLEAYVLRYWEKEFPQLRPKKNRRGSRLYTERDIELVNQIHHLRTKEKLTIAGARKKLMLKRASEEKTELIRTARAQTLVRQIKKDIEDLLKLFP